MAKSGLSILDPLEMWRDALAQWEGTANKVAGKQLKTEEFTKVLHSVSGATMSMQQALTKANKTVLKEMNLASRDDLTEIGERLHRIEDMLEFLCRQVSGKSPAASAPAPMPPRTRVPPTAGAAPAPAPTPAVPAAAAPAVEATTTSVASVPPKAPAKPKVKAVAKRATEAAPATKRPARKKA
ncbi:poly(R)-hydroxyalkanoic acid synthase subunit PhaE [Variovorax rhizosphaerae]|uniref:Poly(3-hydroxyalkanoate) polymerase subunit PhaE n=1 Tax=Variovorax rhizosphaerae TaxID=1836200 RepID=A0ABU8WBZ7_9BURK